MQEAPDPQHTAPPLGLSRHHAGASAAGQVSLAYVCVCISDVDVWKFILRDQYPAGLHYWKLWFGWPSGVKLDSEY